MNPIESGFPVDQIDSMMIKKTSIPATLGLVFGFGSIPLIFISEMLSSSSSGYVIKI